MVTKAKMWAAVIGSTCTAIAAALAVVPQVLADGVLSAGEIALVASTVATLVGTVYAVWKVENKPAQDR